MSIAYFLKKHASSFFIKVIAIALLTVSAAVATITLPQPAEAAALFNISSKDLLHAQSALYFARKNDWRQVRYHAAAIEDTSIRALGYWIYYRSKENGASFQEITRFIDEHPTWPELSLLQQRAEEALNSDVPYATIVAWFDKRPPVSGDGHRFYGQAKASLFLRGSKTTTLPSHIEQLVRQAWVKGNFGQKDEQAFLDTFGSYLRLSDHHGRIDTLLWQEKIGAAKRILGYADPAHRKLFTARMQLMERKVSESVLQSVPPSLSRDPGLLYQRILFRTARGDDRGARELLKTVPAEAPYPGKWWDIRSDQIRLLIKTREYKTAYHLAANHGNKEGQAFAEAEWLAGWLSLRFLKEPRKAYTHFYRLYHGVEFPVSLSRGAYWAGRAAEANQNKEIALQWFKLSAKYIDTFYGQLAQLHMAPKSVLSLPADPTPTKEDKHYVSNHPFAKAAYVLSMYEQEMLARKFLKHAVSQAKTPGQMALFGEMGVSLKQHDMAVEAAKQAARKGVILPKVGYPLPHLEQPMPIEKAMTLAIVRQESQFDRHAESPAGALGLMQLLPSTARDMARISKLPFNVHRLNDPSYNVKLGTRYVQKLLSTFDGSYILAIAAYNGGQGNVNKWIREYGDPRRLQNPDDVIDWIETIPFSETRNYVQRVLEGLQVYRSLLSRDKHSLIALHKDLYPQNALLLKNDSH